MGESLLASARATTNWLRLGRFTSRFRRIDLQLAVLAEISRFNMDQRGSLLPPLLANSLTSSSAGAAPLVVLSDSLLQPGLLLPREIISSTLDR